MNGAFLHLALNHIPVVGMPFCFLLLLVGVCRKSQELTSAGLAALVLVALITILTFRSGGPAARVVRNYPGIERALIHNHAEAADDIFWSVEILGAAALMGLWFSRRWGVVPKWLVGLVMLGALVASGWLGWVAHLGGLIRHPESAFGAAAPPSPVIPH